MGDDSFSAFRDWLISRGQEVYESVLQNPDNLADVPGVQEGGITAESMHGVMYDAYEDRFDRDLPDHLGPDL